MAPRVRNPVLSLPWPEIDPWPGKLLHCCGCSPPKKNFNKKEKRDQLFFLEIRVGVPFFLSDYQKIGENIPSHFSLHEDGQSWVYFLLGFFHASLLHNYSHTIHTTLHII